MDGRKEGEEIIFPIFRIKKRFGVFLDEVAGHNQNFVWHSRNGAPHLLRGIVSCPSSANKCSHFGKVEVGRGSNKTTKKRIKTFAKSIDFFLLIWYN
jgi:hypothetical protein